MFSRPVLAGAEAAHLAEAAASTVWHGDGPATQAASAWLSRFLGARTLLTTSCTHALELAALLLRLGPGDEVIVPAFTFPSTATAVALRGATPVLVDVEPRTLGLCPQATRAALTERTKAVFLVHYAGVGAQPTEFRRLADEHGLALVEDNAHGFGATWQGRLLGTFGALATQSWHDTKNVTCGEGGALVVNDAGLVARAEILREKGTDRARFFRGEVDRYTWVDHGSSYVLSDLLAAILLGQLERFEQIQAHRQATWAAYDRVLPTWARDRGIRTMFVPDEAAHSAHMYYLLMPSNEDQLGLIAHLAARDIVATFHYQPLDRSPAGRVLGRTPQPCDVAADVSERLVRLPLHTALTDAEIERVLEAVTCYEVRA